MPRTNYYNEALITSNCQVADKTFRLTIIVPEIAAHAMPGQFVSLSSKSINSSTLLKRPISIESVDGNSVTLLIKKVGPMTTAFYGLKEGETVGIIGPLGNCFSNLKSKRILLVGGGIGIAPLLMLKSELEKERNQVDLIYAVKSRSEAIKLDTKNSYLHIDEEAGGFVTETVKNKLEKNDYDEIKTCGPTVMMKSIYECSKKYKIKVEVSLETYMACGFGVCLGCAIETTSGLSKVCKDGPVFDAKELWI